MLALAAFALCLARGEANRGFALGLRAVRTGSPPDDDAVETALRAHDAGARGGGDAAAAARGLLERLVDGRAELAFRRRAAAARDAAAAARAAAAAAPAAAAPPAAPPPPEDPKAEATAVEGSSGSAGAGSSTDAA